MYDDWKKQITRLKYVEPTKEAKKIVLLGYLIESTDYTQRKLASLLGITPSQVNVYLKELVANGLIEPLGNGKNKKYIVTSEGRWFYRVEMFRFFRELGMWFVSMGKVFEGVKEPLSGDEVVLYGAGEICQMLVPLLRLWGKRIVAIIDDYSTQTTCMGVDVLKNVSENIRGIKDKVLIIASFKGADEMIDKMRNRWNGEILRFVFDEISGEVKLQKILGGG